MIYNIVSVYKYKVKLFAEDAAPFFRNQNINVEYENIKHDLHRINE